jgi:hypothetical protein
VYFTLRSSGPILGIANRYYGYEIRNQLSVEWQRHRFPGIRLHRQQQRYIWLLDSSDNLRIGSPSQYLYVNLLSALFLKHALYFYIWDISSESNFLLYFSLVSQLSSFFAPYERSQFEFGSALFSFFSCEG